MSAGPPLPCPRNRKREDPTRSSAARVRESRSSAGRGLGPALREAADFFAGGCEPGHGIDSIDIRRIGLGPAGGIGSRMVIENSARALAMRTRTGPVVLAIADCVTPLRKCAAAGLALFFSAISATLATARGAIGRWLRCGVLKIACGLGILCGPRQLARGRHCALAARQRLRGLDHAPEANHRRSCW